MGFNQSGRWGKVLTFKWDKSHQIVIPSPPPACLCLCMVSMCVLAGRKRGEGALLGQRLLLDARQR
eukprot:1972949-Rhodomonas_salina.1